MVEAEKDDVANALARRLADCISAKLK